jgi:hypothetical protein
MAILCCVAKNSHRGTITKTKPLAVSLNLIGLQKNANFQFVEVA